MADFFPIAPNPFARPAQSLAGRFVETELVPVGVVGGQLPLAQPAPAPISAVPDPELVAEARLARSQGIPMTPAHAQALQRAEMTHQAPPGFSRMQAATSAKPVRPSFDPMAGVKPMAKPAAAEAEEETEAPAPSRPTTLAGVIERMTPAQRAALASQYVSVGGGGGGVARSTLTKRTPQLPGLRQTIGDVEQEQRAAILDKSEAEAERARREALEQRGNLTALDARIKSFDAQQAAQQAKIAEQDARYARARAEVAEMKVDPDRWWSTRDTSQRVALTIAAALSGFAQGWRGQGGPNPVIESINQAIDRDVAAQRAMIAKKGADADAERGVLGDLQARLGSSLQAEIQARQMLTDAAGMRLKEIEATTRSPAIKAAAREAAAGVSLQGLQLRQLSYAAEAGEQTISEKRVPGSPGRSVSKLDLLRQQALADAQGDAALQKAQLEGVEAKKKREKLEAPPEEGGGKPALEEGPVASQLRNAQQARLALGRLWNESRDVWMGKVEAMGKTPWGSTWKTRLDNLADAAAAKLAAATGRDRETWRKALRAKWDNSDDIRARIMDAENLLGDDVAANLDTSEAKYDVTSLRALEKRNALRMKLILRK